MAKLRKKDIIVKGTSGLCRGLKDMKIDITIKYENRDVVYATDKFGFFTRNVAVGVGKKMHEVLMGAYGPFKGYGFVARKPETEIYYQRYAREYIPEAMYFSGYTADALESFGKSTEQTTAEGKPSIAYAKKEVGKKEIGRDIGKRKGMVKVDTPRLRLTSESEFVLKVDYIAKWDESGKRPLKAATIAETVVDQKSILTKAFKEAYTYK